MLLGVTLGLCSALPARARAETTLEPPEAAPTATDTRDTEQGAGEFEATVRAAVALFEAKQFEGALRAFERAIALGADDEQLATLHFDAGVCAFELGRFEDAERSFATSAAFGTPGRDMARIHAAFAAVRANALERAERHFAQLSPEGRALPLAAELTRELNDERTRRASESALDALHQGFDELERGDDASAHRSFARARLAYDALPTRARADLEYGEARLAERRGELELALTHLERAARLEPEACELYRYRGRLLAHLDRPDAALDAQRRAFSCARTEQEATRAQAELDALHPLGREGLRGYLQLSGGYDDNAAQSGTASRLDAAPWADETASPSALVASPLLAVSGRLTYDHRLAFDWALVPSLQTSSLLFTASEAQGSSLAVQELALGLAHAPDARTRVELDLGAAALTSELPPFAPLSFEAFARADVERRVAPHWALWASLRFSDVTGADSAPSLTGYRAEGELGGRFTPGAWSLGARARLTWNRAGTVAWTTTPDAFVCARRGFGVGPGCELLGFEVPGSYFTPGIDVDAAYWFGDVLRVGGAAGLGQRNYLEPVRVYRGPRSALLTEKTRRDVTVDLALELRVLPWSSVDVYGFLRESARLNTSNMHPDASDANHRFDYDDRNYSQLVSEAGVGVAF